MNKLLIIIIEMTQKVREAEGKGKEKWKLNYLFLYPPS